MIHTITIGIPAYNEERNISNVINSVLLQKLTNSKISRIIICSDGSSDSTVKISKQFKDNRILIIDNKIRKGLSRGLNQIIDHSSSDILIILQADVIIDDDKFISKLIDPIIKKQADLTAGLIVELKQKNTLGKILSVSMQLKRNLFSLFKSGNNVYTCFGPSRAYSKRFYKLLNFPSLPGDDMFSYLSCIKKGFKFKLVNNAKIIYQVPLILSDHEKQSTRFFISINEYEKIFGKSFVHYETSIPFFVIFLGILKCIPIILFNPTEVLSYFFIQMIFNFKNMFYKKTVSDKWDIANTSKIIQS